MIVSSHTDGINASKQSRYNHVYLKKRLNCEGISKLFVELLIQQCSIINTQRITGGFYA